MVLPHRMKLDVCIYKCSECDVTDTSRSAIVRHIRDSDPCGHAIVMQHVFSGLEFPDTQCTATIDAFFNSSYVHFNPEQYCQFDEFKRALQAFETEHGTRVKHGIKFYAESFAKRGLTFLAKSPKPIIIGIELFRTEFLPIAHHDTDSTHEVGFHPVNEFLLSDKVVLGPNKYCPYDDFKGNLKIFEIEHGYNGSKYTTDFFRQPFVEFKIVKVRDELEYRGRTMKREYLVGVDLV